MANTITFFSRMCASVTTSTTENFRRISHSKFKPKQETLIRPLLTHTHQPLLPPPPLPLHILFSVYAVSVSLLLGILFLREEWITYGGHMCCTPVYLHILLVFARARVFFFFFKGFCFLTAWHTNCATVLRNVGNESAPSSLLGKVAVTGHSGQGSRQRGSQHVSRKTSFERILASLYDTAHPITRTLVCEVTDIKRKQNKTKNEKKWEERFLFPLFYSKGVCARWHHVRWSIRRSDRFKHTRALSCVHQTVFNDIERCG